MATVLQTNTVLGVIGTDFTLVTSYSGEVNPNVTFVYILTVKDIHDNVIVGATVEINSIEYTTDSNGQITVDLIRGYYIANVSKIGFTSGTDTFTILDQNVSNDINLSQLGSFDSSFDDSFVN